MVHSEACVGQNTNFPIIRIKKLLQKAGIDQPPLLFPIPFFICATCKGALAGKNVGTSPLFRCDFYLRLNVLRCRVAT